MMPCQADAHEPIGKTRKVSCLTCAKLVENGGKCLGEIGTWMEVE